MDKEINVDELIKATNDAIPICYIGEMRPVYSNGYSCAMSMYTREQGFINGIPYSSMSLNGFNNIACGLQGLPDIRGCCARISTPIDPNLIIVIPPNLQKG